jgi:hypothetical protein
MNETANNESGREKMKAGEKRLYWAFGRNLVVTLVEKVTGGWLIRLPSGMLVGPVEENAAVLR